MSCLPTENFPPIMLLLMSNVLGEVLVPYIDNDSLFMFGLTCRAVWEQVKGQKLRTSWLSMFRSDALMKWASDRNISYKPTRLKEFCVSAAYLGYLRAIKWVYESEKDLVLNTSAINVAAACSGNINVIRWLHAQRCDLSRCVTPAAEAGHLRVVRWLYNKHYELDVYTASFAAQGGHLHVLQWLYAKACPWNCSLTFRAANNGHFDVLKWAIAYGCKWDVEIENCDLKPEVREWALANGYLLQ